MTVEKGAEIEDMGSLDFGGGSDTLVLNGKIALTGTITGLEKISGNGTLIVGDWNGKVQIDDALADKFQKAGISIVNSLGAGIDGADPVKESQADNTRAGAKVLSLKNDEIDFWLCGGELASSVEYGLEDAVDYIKFTKSSSWDEISVSVYGDDNFTVKLLDSKGQLVQDLTPECQWGSCYLSDDLLKNGKTYYLELAVDPGASVSGWVDLDD